MPAKEKTCKYCKAKKPIETMVQINMAWFCNWDHGVEHGKSLAEKSRAKETKKRKTKNRKAVRELNRKTLKWQHKQTQTAFNRLRVLEEINWFKDRVLTPTCVSCGKPDMDWCCGHFKTRGSQSGLRYDRKNTFLQCNRYCNMALSGNIEGSKSTHGYKKGLILRFGLEEGQAIIDYCESNVDPAKWTCEELDEFRAECNKQARGYEGV